jgi:hypothetical protein
VQEAVLEVPVEKQVALEVPVEVIREVTVELIRDVPVEKVVIQEVPVEVIREVVPLLAHTSSFLCCMVFASQLLVFSLAMTFCQDFSFVLLSAHSGLE